MRLQQAVVDGEYLDGELKGNGYVITTSKNADEALWHLVRRASLSEGDKLPPGAPVPDDQASSHIRPGNYLIESYGNPQHFLTAPVIASSSVEVEIVDPSAQPSTVWAIAPTSSKKLYSILVAESGLRMTLSSHDNTSVWKPA